MRNIIKWLGGALMAAGVLGFVPALTPDDNLLGIFQVNGLHNIIHIATGAGLWYAAKAEDDQAKMYLKVFGVVYALVAVLGFMAGEEPILGLIDNNMADNWLHVGLTALFLYAGFRNQPLDA